MKNISLLSIIFITGLMPSVYAQDCGPANLLRFSQLHTQSQHRDLFKRTFNSIRESNAPVVQKGPLIGLSVRISELERARKNQQMFDDIEAVSRTVLQSVLEEIECDAENMKMDGDSFIRSPISSHIFAEKLESISDKIDEMSAFELSLRFRMQVSIINQFWSEGSADELVSRRLVRAIIRVNNILIKRYIDYDPLDFSEAKSQN